MATSDRLVRAAERLGPFCAHLFDLFFLNLIALIWRNAPPFWRNKYTCSAKTGKRLFLTKTGASPRAWMPRIFEFSPRAVLTTWF
jgi:hypothetical protein